jgi:hypothetical protein
MALIGSLDQAKTMCASYQMYLGKQTFTLLQRQKNFPEMFQLQNDKP